MKSLYLCILVILLGISACGARVTEDLHGVCGDPDAGIDSPPPDSTPPPLKPGILIGGQSNAQGRKPCTGVTVASGACGSYSYSVLFDQESDTPPTPFVWQVNRGPVNLSPRGGNNFGVEMPLGILLHAAGKDVGFAKAAVGSTSLALHWQNHCYTTGCTPVVYPPAPDDPLWLKLEQQGERLEALGYEIRVIVWIQGEHDAAYSSYAAHYEENLTTHFLTLHNRWPNAKIVFNQLDSDFILNATNTVRTAQANVAANYPLGTPTNPAVIMISSEGLDHDSAHFEANGLWNLGVRFYDVINPLIPN